MRAERIFSRSTGLWIILVLLVTAMLVGTVSALTGYRFVGTTCSGCGGSSVTTYSSTILMSDWKELGDSLYEIRISNSPTCISRIAVSVPGKVKSTGSDHLSYAIAGYSDQLTTEQKKELDKATGADPAQNLRYLKSAAASFGSGSGNNVPAGTQEDLKKNPFSDPIHDTLSMNKYAEQFSVHSDFDYGERTEFS